MLRLLSLGLVGLLAGAPVVFTPGSRLIAVAHAAAPPETIERIALVDVQRCILETNDGKTAKTQLEKDFAKAQARLDKKAQDVEKQVRDLQSKAAMLSEAELRKRQEEILRQQQQLQQLAMELQNDVAEKEALLTERIYKNVAALVEQIALEENLQIVLVKSEMNILYANPKLDLTNRVIVRYDKEHQ